MTTLDLALLETHVAVHDLIARLRDADQSDVGGMLLLVAEGLTALERTERHLDGPRTGRVAGR